PFVVRLSQLATETTVGTRRAKAAFTYSTQPRGSVMKGEATTTSGRLPRSSCTTTGEAGTTRSASLQSPRVTIEEAIRSPTGDATAGPRRNGTFCLAYRL